ncbi:hypothetical protein ASPWEDRAFT_41473 [Aspergillus wentii DTO 134E9]|uniref:Extracellular membrane protein CFEM domain-containing protein n=1 Tax=Aspergillus wentii DTO 134E9 TaxID=1073089 RepID=A0A1L9RFB6_ASPWE|nr:uncharacterized protein ASPWEDRAFT_41473 [Aspergillus wentii DTO 134E9]KAI9925384.1 hypothetical protein MW887_005765 [Aspergillus wentii]OJJ33615.1 hypothetical protein ASPWEDRAFT_41473 [Aspergillus wentii DTO 134E9]
MVRITALLTVAFAAVALATTNDQCQNKFDVCRSSGDPNMSACAAEHAQCCSDAFDTCRSSGDPNEAECAAQNAACKGQK